VVEVHRRKIKWKPVIIGRNGPFDYYGKQVLNCLIFIGGYLQFVERAPACSIVFTWVRSFRIGKETAQVAVHEWYCNTFKEWCCEAIRKLLRRWLRCTALGGEYVELAVV
jgi:hypothetical protein